MRRLSLALTGAMACIGVAGAQVPQRSGSTTGVQSAMVEGAQAMRAVQLAFLCGRWPEARRPTFVAGREAANALLASLYEGPDEPRSYVAGVIAGSDLAASRMAAREFRLYGLAACATLDQPADADRLARLEWLLNAR